MQMVDVISNRALMDVLAALNDSAENARNVADVMPDKDAALLYTEMAERFDKVADKLYLLAELSHNDIQTIVDALNSSIDNCVEAELDDARVSYEQTRVEVRDVERV